MRFIIYGTGAIGGTLAARLFLCGYETIAIARGRQLAAIQQNGLRLRTPETDEVAKLACVSGPHEIIWQPDDVIILTMKGQDTWAALESMRDAGVDQQAIICAQNGVDNERQALRLFPNVYGCTVMMPAAYIVPGEVNAFGTPRHGLFDLGRYPSGTDAAVTQICDAFNASGFDFVVHEQVMRSKYGKLLGNTANAADAALGDTPARKDMAKKAHDECKTVFAAAGIAYDDLSSADPLRKQLLKEEPIKGADRIGSSSAQSLARGVGSIETDYLNGEVVLLARLHNVEAPVNEMLCRLARIMLDENLRPGSVTHAHLKRAGWNG